MSSRAEDEDDEEDLEDEQSEVEVKLEKRKKTPSKPKPKPKRVASDYQSHGFHLYWKTETEEHYLLIVIKQTGLSFVVSHRTINCIEFTYSCDTPPIQAINVVQNMSAENKGLIYSQMQPMNCVWQVVFDKPISKNSKKWDSYDSQMNSATNHPIDLYILKIPKKKITDPDDKYLF